MSYDVYWVKNRAEKIAILNTLPFWELYGVEVSHVPTAHTQSAGYSWVRGYGETP